ncbi:hypothetical protein SS05631_a46970 (plasmid) [Sinorhizobium sp. CCBAU 05631]|nr:hypothetical protein SS05631_a46970 [Sinorhizobium sp. CCBAU 05631]
MCLFAKRLEHGKFVWPPKVDGVLQMSQPNSLSSWKEWTRSNRHLGLN